MTFPLLRYLFSAMLLAMSGMLWSQEHPSLRFDPEIPAYYDMESSCSMPGLLSLFSTIDPVPAPHQALPDLSRMAYNFNDLAFFCRIEVKLEKAARFPVKFRLGDVQYVDELEGK